MLVIVAGGLAAWRFGLLDFGALGAEAAPPNIGAKPLPTGKSTQPYSENSPCIIAANDPNSVNLRLSFVVNATDHGSVIYTGKLYWDNILHQIPIVGAAGNFIAPTIHFIVLNTTDGRSCVEFDSTTTDNNGDYHLERAIQPDEARGYEVFARATATSLAGPLEAVSRVVRVLPARVLLPA